MKSKNVYLLLLSCLLMSCNNVTDDSENKNKSSESLEDSETGSSDSSTIEDSSSSDSTSIDDSSSSSGQEIVSPLKDFTMNVTKEGTYVFEAEYCDLSKYKGNNKLVNDTNASNFYYVGVSLNDSKLSFKLNLDKAYEVVMKASYLKDSRYPSDELDMRYTYQYIIDENKLVGLSENYILSDTSFKEITYDAYTLAEGVHTFDISVYKDSVLHVPNIDYISFELKEIKPFDPSGIVVPANDFHTPLQYAYNHDIYSNVHNYAKGSEEVSAPAGIQCDFSDDESVGVAQSYMIQLATNAEFSDARTITGLKEKVYSYTNPMLGEHIFYRGATQERKLSRSKVYEVTVTTEGTRNCYLAGVSNVRDIGGYSSYLAVNGKIRQGLYYRGAQLDDIKASGKDELVNHLKVKSEIDLRDSNLCLGPYVEGVNYYPVPIWSGSEPIRFEEFAKEYKQIFEIVEHADVAPVYLHCKAGADRTGISTFFLLCVCGVSYEDMARDYLWTNLSTQGARYLNSEFNNWYNKLEQYEGDTKAEKCKKHLMTKGISEETIENIRKIFIENYQ